MTTSPINYSNNFNINPATNVSPWQGRTTIVIDPSYRNKQPITGGGVDGNMFNGFFQSLVVAAVAIGALLVVGTAVLTTFASGGIASIAAGSWKPGLIASGTVIGLLVIGGYFLLRAGQGSHRSS